MARKQFLAFDLGAESGRAVIGSLTDKLSLSEVHRFSNINGKITGHLHWNLLAQWEELKIGLARAVVQTTDGALAGIGVDTWGVDFALLGNDGQILANPLMYRDSGSDGMVELACQKLGRQRIFQTTGIQLLQINTLYHLLGLKQRKSSALQAAHTLLFMPDVFNYLFSGVRKSELSIASTSQMYDPRQKRWANEMLQDLGLPSQILPEIIPPGTILGNLLPEVAGECRAPSIPIIAPGCHDTASAVAAVPVEPGQHWCYISSGTWSLMGVELDEPVVSDKALQYNYTNEMGVGSKIRFLKNIMGLWMVQECRRDFSKRGHDHDYAQLTSMARQAPPFGPLVDPNHDSFLKPGDFINKINHFCAKTHQAAPSTPGQYIRTCLESLALIYRRTLEGLEEILQKKIAVIHIVGGGTQNELLNQMTASACCRPVVAGPIEATAIGNILVQAIATGEIKSLAQARAIVRNSFDVKRYEPADKAPWDAAYERYKTITVSP